MTEQMVYDCEEYLNYFVYLNEPHDKVLVGATATLDTAIMIAKRYENASVVNRENQLVNRQSTTDNNPDYLPFY